MSWHHENQTISEVKKVTNISYSKHRHTVYNQTQIPLSHLCGSSRGSLQFYKYFYYIEKIAYSLSNKPTLKNSKN